MAKRSRLDRAPDVTAATVLIAPTLAAAAQQLGVTPRGLDYWLAKPENRARVEAVASKHFGDALEQTFEGLIKLGPKAVKALEAVLDKPDQEGHVQGIRVVLDRLSRLHDRKFWKGIIGELDARLAGSDDPPQ